MKKKNCSTAPTTEHATLQGAGLMNRSFACKTNIFSLGGTNSKSVTIFSTAGAIFLTTVVVFLTGTAIFATGIVIFATGIVIFSSGVVIFATGTAIFSTGIDIFATGTAIFSTGDVINSKLEAGAAGTYPYEMPVFGYRQMAA